LSPRFPSSGRAASPSILRARSSRTALRNCRRTTSISRRGRSRRRVPFPEERTVRATGAGGALRVEPVTGRVGVRASDVLAATLAHMFRLDDDLSAFYAVVSNDGELSWCAQGAGRMLRAPTVFEDVVKTKRTLIRTSGRTGEPYALARPIGACASAHPRARALGARATAPTSARSLVRGRSERC
jgi:hypothetical protein